MQDFIQNVSSHLGISQEQAQSATSGVINLLKQQMNPSDFQELQQKLPGSDQVAQQQQQQAPSQGSEQASQQSPSQVSQESVAQSSQQSSAQQSSAGGWGGIAQSVVGGLEGGGGIMGALSGMLGRSGLSGNQVSSFVSMFLDYVRSKAGSGMLDKILQQVPGLKSLAPTAAAPS